MDDITWHIEPTSKCILECPLCDRTWFYKKFKKRELHEINIDHLLKFFNGVPYTVNFCGNNSKKVSITYSISDVSLILYTLSISVII